jgi:hypothetical protein
MNIQEITQEKLLMSKLLEQQQYIATLLEKLIERNGTIEELFYGHHQMTQDIKSAAEKYAAEKETILATLIEKEQEIDKLQSLVDSLSCGKSDTEKHPE